MFLVQSSVSQSASPVFLFVSAYILKLIEKKLDDNVYLLLNKHHH